MHKRWFCNSRSINSQIFTDDDDDDDDDKNCLLSVTGFQKSHCKIENQLYTIIDLLIYY